MTNLTDLPDDSLLSILSHFKLSPQRSRYLRRADETLAYTEDHAQDFAKQADLASLVQTCKVLCRLASPLLYEDLYLHVDMLRSSAATIEQYLARLANRRSLQHLICALWTDQTRIKNFFVCVFNAPASNTLRSLSVSLYGTADPGTIDLRCLSRLPNLVGLELRIDADWNLFVPPSTSLPSLRELHVGAHGPLSQVVNLLSVAPSTMLESLDIDWCVRDVHVSATLWTQLLGNQTFPNVHTLSLRLLYNGTLPAGVLAETPTYFPSLRNFHLKCGSSETDYHTLLSDALFTSLSFTPRDVRDLRALLLSVSTDLAREPRLQTIRITLDNVHVDVWDPVAGAWRASSTLASLCFSSDLIQLARDACSIARAHGVHLRPVDLIVQLEERQRLEIEELKRSEQLAESNNAAGWGNQLAWGDQTWSTA